MKRAKVSETYCIEFTPDEYMKVFERETFLRETNHFGSLIDCSVCEVPNVIDARLHSDGIGDYLTYVVNVYDANASAANHSVMEIVKKWTNE